MPLMRIVDLRQERRKEKSAAILSEKLRTAIAASPRKTRTDHPVSESARFFYFASLQRLRRSAQLPQLQRRAHLSSDTAARLSCHFCGHTAAVPKKCPACGKDALIYAGFGTEKVEIERRADFSESGRPPNGCGLDDAQGGLSRNAAKISAPARSTSSSARK